MLKRIGFGLLLAVILTTIVVIGGAAKQSDVCPHDNGWEKIDSDDLSSYPVDGAIEYCFKGGSENSNCTSYLVYGDSIDVIPNGEHVCGLSHWSYRLGEDDPTPTPTDTPEEPTPTPTPPDDPTPTPTPPDEPTVTPTPFKKTSW